MIAPASRRIVKTWAVLVAATLLGFAFVEGLGGARAATTAAILLAMFKVNVVIERYMDLRWRHAPLRAVMAVWLGVVAVILLVGLWVA